MIKIIPSILTNNPQESREMLMLCEGLVERVQVDIVDGEFATNKTIEPSALDGIEISSCLDFHLMTKEPINWVEKAARAGADRIIGQIELMQNQMEFVGKIQELGLKAGLAIDINTPIDQLNEEIINDLDLVLVMSVPAGFGGQEFDRRAIEKVKKLDAVRAKDLTPFNICVDGGVNLKVIRELKLLGVDEVVVGKSIFKDDLPANLEQYLKAAGGVI